LSHVGLTLERHIPMQIAYELQVNEWAYSTSVLSVIKKSYMQCAVVIDLSLFLKPSHVIKLQSVIKH